MTRVARAIEKGETQGFIKIIVDGDTQEILGAAILGVGGDEVVHGILDIMYANAPYTTLQRAVHIHPTVSELVPTVLAVLPDLVSGANSSGRRMCSNISYGRQRWYTIGKHGAPWTPDTARDEARRLLGEVVKGHDPADGKEAVRKAPLVAELIEQYLAEARSGKLLTGRGNAKKASTLVTDTYRLAAHVTPAIGHLKVNAVGRHDIERLRDRLMDDGGGAARTLGLVGAVFQFSVRKGLRADNPVRGIDRPADGKRTRRLSDDEFNALGSALTSGISGVWLPALSVTKFLALTGWRLGEAANLRWADIDAVTRTARLSDTKTGASVRPLSHAAIAVIRALPRSGGKNLPALSRTVKRILQMAGLPDDISAHTLRHSFASVAADLGMSELTIAALLGHSKASVTSRYSHFADAVILQAADRVADEIVRRMGGEKAGGTIVELRGKL